MINIIFYFCTAYISRTYIAVGELNRLNVALRNELAGSINVAFQLTHISSYLTKQIIYLLSALEHVISPLNTADNRGMEV